MIDSLPIYQNKNNLQREAYNFVMQYVKKEELNKVTDIFAGTASLSIPFFRHANEILLNDKYKFLYYYLSFYTKLFKGDLGVELKYAFETIKNIELYKGNIYEWYSHSGKTCFFGKNDAIKIDSIHKYLYENKDIYNQEIYDFLYGNFIYCVYQASNIKNGYFYTKSKKTVANDNVFNFTLLKTNNYFANKNIKVFNYDSKDFIKLFSGDLLIIDPPIKRKYLNLYYPLEYLAQNPFKGVQNLYYEDEYAYFNKKYMESLIGLINRADYKYVFLYLEDRVYNSFPKLFFELYICHKIKLKKGYFVLLEKI